MSPRPAALLTTTLLILGLADALIPPELPELESFHPCSLLEQGSGLAAHERDAEFELFRREYGHRIDFCFSTDRGSLRALINESFPLDACGTAPVADPVCRSPMEAICGAEQTWLYFEYGIGTGDTDRTPNSNACLEGSTLECSSGFFDAAPDGARPDPRPCCDGFFCPAGFKCMLPCPLGATCHRASPVTADLSGPGGVGEGQSNVWCSPYGYRQRDGRCGGADRWISDSLPKPQLKLPNVTNGIYCPGGSYCPQTTQPPVKCKAGHFCRKGTYEMAPCHKVLSLNCPAGTNVPKPKILWLEFMGTLLVLMVFIYQSSMLYNRIMRRLSYKDRLVFTWGMRPQILVVPRQVPASAYSGETISNIETEMTGPSPDSSRSRAPTQPGDGLDPVWATIDTPLLDRNHGDDGLVHRDGHGPLRRLSSTLLYGEEHSSTRGTQLSVEFYGLTVKLRSYNKILLQGATGKLRASRITAIMGPSGAGKTSLLTTLAGKGGSMQVTGRVLINGKEESLEQYKHIMGFVPQSDIMYWNQTVEENLLFTARYRLPKYFSHTDHRKQVERAIQVLQLERVRHQLVGNEEYGGISGGERKRVNIGLELVVDPSVLFLDEPTSGLDSTSTVNVVEGLQQIAHRNHVTTVAVIHQPNPKVYSMFDDILLLGMGGKTVYYGTQQGVQRYFNQLGFVYGLHENPADVNLDIIMGSIPRGGHPDHRPSELPALWEASSLCREQWTKPDLERDALHESQELTDGMVPSTVQAEGNNACVGCRESALGGRIEAALFAMVSLWSLVLDILTQGKRAAEYGVARVAKLLQGDWGPLEEEREAAPSWHRDTPGFVRQFYWLFCRAVVQRMREPLTIFIEYTIYALSGMVLGWLAADRDTNMSLYANNLGYSNVAIGLLSTISALRPLTNGRLVYYRETARGLQPLAYFLALDVFGLFGALARATAYVIPWLWYAQPRALWGDMFGITVLTVYSCTGTGYFLSTILNYGAAQLTAAVVSLISVLLVRRSSHGFLSVMKGFSFARWALEAGVLVQAKRMTGVWLLERCASLHALGYSLGHLGRCLWRLVGLGLMFRALALVALSLSNRSRQI
eukprot:evm.model.scf_562.5 EVM.evm.TU.scf_562.5   scf_562:63542-73807(+)